MRAVDAFVSTIVLIALFVIEQFTPSWQAVYAPIPLLILVAFTLGVTFAISATVVYMRDLRIALPLIIQLGLFVTPVAYGISTIASTRAGFIFYSALNPLAPVIDGCAEPSCSARAPTGRRRPREPQPPRSSSSAGFMLFKRLETGLADFA